MSESTSDKIPVTPKIMEPAPLLERRGARALLIAGLIALLLVVGLRVCMWQARRWNPHGSQHMAVRNSLYYLVDRVRIDVTQGRGAESAFRVWAPEVLQRPEMSEFSIYLSDQIVEHGADSKMPRITPLRFAGEGAPTAGVGTGPSDFFVIAARRTGADEALVWGMSAQRDIVFREFEIQRPALQ